MTPSKCYNIMTEEKGANMVKIGSYHGVPIYKTVGAQAIPGYTVNGEFCTSLRFAMYLIEIEEAR